MGLELKQKALMKLNLRLFLDMHMLREGAFQTVGSGQMFYDGQDMSLLLPDTSADDTLFGVSDGQVWQSPFRQWVYESGVPIDGTNVVSSPVVASGLFIEGAFRPTDDPTFGHTIDFLNGRIIFDSPQSLDLKVQSVFSTRDVRMGFEFDFNNQFRRGYLESKFTTNPLTSMQIVYPSGAAQPFPAVFIEVDGREFESYELGNRSQIILDEVKLHIWALDDLQRDNIVDILTGQVGKTLPILDFNIAPLPLSGLNNTLSNEYVPYQEMLRNRELITTVGSGTPVRYMARIKEVKSFNVEAMQEYERALVVYRVETFLNAPTTPLGHVFGPISSISTIQDTGFPDS
jgi:hypothetical protein